MNSWIPLPHRSVLVVIDMQEKLLNAIEDRLAARLVKTTRLLVEVARAYEMPILATEQYPQGLGLTVEPIRQALEEASPVEKLTFSAWSDPNFRKRLLGLGRDQVWLVGIETHVCVLQTALHLLEGGFLVWVAADGVGSREEIQLRIGLDTMREAGVTITTSEILVFGLLERAGTEKFRKLTPFLK
jgi:nicotinamidase-related amidase